MSASKDPNLTIGRNLKIALFHLGSGIADVLATGVWNRVMVADLGFSATFVGLLTGLRYFLAPLGISAGRYSDRQPVAGYRRLFWIWLGRVMMTLSTVALGFATAELVDRALSGAAAQPPPLIVLTLLASFMLFSLGNAISGSTFLALIHDRAAESQRGRAVGIVWTFLMLGFALSGVLFSILLPEEAVQGQLGFSAESLLSLFLGTAVLLALLWFFSILGEERRSSSSPLQSQPAQTDLRADLAQVWQHGTLRFFLFYLTLSMAFVFLQDTVLEPFAGEIFAMPAHITNRFAAYWGGTAILASGIALMLAARSRRITNETLARGGIVVLLFAYAIFVLTAVQGMRALIKPGLLLLGTGMGMWNIGTLGMMMTMSPAGRAGTFLGFWTFCVTIARGAGVAGGGILRDATLILSGDGALAYAAVFACGFLGLLASLYLLRLVQPPEKADNSRLLSPLAQALD